jgi:hypothetical protein
MGSKVFSAVLLLSIIVLMLSGCVDTSSRTNLSDNMSDAQENLSSDNSSTQANGTAGLEGNATQNQSAAPSWPRYNTSTFSFAYPPNISLSEQKSGTGGLITGSHELPERIEESMAIKYIDTEAAYGQAKDFAYKANPTKAASDFLLQDKNQDTMGFFMKADRIGDISTFTLGTDVFCAEMPFSLRMNTGTRYTGYALTLFIPSRSMLVDVRIVADDQSLAKTIRDGFIYGFRLV